MFTNTHERTHCNAIPSKTASFDFSLQSVLEADISFRTVEVFHLHGGCGPQLGDQKFNAFAQPHVRWWVNYLYIFIAKGFVPFRGFRRYFVADEDYWSQGPYMDDIVSSSPCTKRPYLERISVAHEFASRELLDLITGKAGRCSTLVVLKAYRLLVHAHHE